MSDESQTAPVAKRPPGIGWQPHYFSLPTTVELENMRKFIRPDGSDTCAKCEVGRIAIEVGHDPLFGCCMIAVCRFNPAGCDFRELVSEL